MRINIKDEKDCSFCFMSSIFGFSQKNSSKFSVTYNKNIETYFLAEILSAEHRKTIKTLNSIK
jgi:hypothetical protein